MCMGCYEERGYPLIDNEKIRAIQPLIEAIYEHHVAGGLLHIVLDDWNIESGMVTYCRSITEHPTEDWMKVTPEEVSATLACCDALEKMTEAERSSALVLYHYPEHFNL